MDKEVYIYIENIIQPLKKKKRIEILPFKTTGMDLEGIMLSEIKSNKETQILYVKFTCRI